VTVELRPGQTHYVGSLRHYGAKRELRILLERQLPGDSTGCSRATALIRAPGEQSRARHNHHGSHLMRTTLILSSLLALRAGAAFAAQSPCACCTTSVT
jgi:hypothetical protein